MLAGQLFLFLLLIFHPVHVSVTNMEYSEGNEDFLVSFKVFTDDFEAIVEKKYGAAMNLGTANENKNAKDYFTRYFRESFSCLINGKELQNPVFIKKKMNDVAVWFYYRYPMSCKVKNVEIKNLIMLDMFSDQSNLLIFKCNDFEKGFVFDREKNSILFHLD